jgi:glutamate 5-kinase
MDTRERLTKHKRLVVKVGTTTITLSNGRLNLRLMDRLSWVLAAMRNKGMEIMLVTSGAIAVGTNRLRLDSRPRDIEGKQAASAVGQAILMQIYENFFAQYNQTVAQVLLTPDVLDDPRRQANARSTFYGLLGMGVIPIVNANDTVSTDELGFSENDSLSALVARLTCSDLLVMLSNVDGLYAEDPHLNPEARHLDEVDEITDEMMAMAGGSGSALGTGGMITKLSAARLAVSAGIDTVIASGEDPAVLFELMDGKTRGTLFRAKAGKY